MPDHYQNPLATLSRNLNRTEVLVKVVYGILAFQCFAALRDWRLWYSELPVNFHPVWAVSWISLDTVPEYWLVTTLAGILLAGCTAVWTDLRWLRTATTIVLLLQFSIEDSMDSIRHGEHALLWVMLIFAFLPSMRAAERHQRHRILSYVRIFALAQVMILLFYFMAGGVKLVTSAVHAMQGDTTLLNPDSGALIIAEWLLRGDADSLMGHWFVKHRMFAWVTVLGSVLLELFALAPLLVRWTQPVVAGGLIAMHVGIGLTMDVWFPENVLLLCVLILSGPALAVSRK